MKVQKLQVGYSLAELRQYFCSNCSSIVSKTRSPRRCRTYVNEDQRMLMLKQVASTADNKNITDGLFGIFMQEFCGFCWAAFLDYILHLNISKTFKTKNSFLLFAKLLLHVGTFKWPKEWKLKQTSSFSFLHKFLFWTTPILLSMSIYVY